MDETVIQAETAAPTQNKGQFVKGDKRINRKGRPRSFDALRKLAQEIAKEQLGETDYTRIEAILRKWAGGDYQEQKAFVEIAYGKVPDELNVRVKDIDAAIERELARVSGQVKTVDAGEASTDTDAAAQ